MPKKNKSENKIHLIGICGVGMSALAVLLKKAGFKVSGSDSGFYEPVLEYLKRNKIAFHEGYRPRNIPSGAKLVVIGKHAGLSAAENPETREAEKRGLRIKSLPEMLALLSAKTENIIVAGSFGKSTLAALLAWCLHEAKKDPSYFIGAIPLDLKNSAHLGKGKEFVLEGDEYPSANWDKSSKFLHWQPTAVLLTSAMHDHVNVFPTEKSYQEPYKKLVAKIPKNGFLVYAKNAKNNSRIAKYAKCHLVSYACPPKPGRRRGVDDKKALWHAENLKYGKITSFDLMRKGKKIARLQTKLLGRHNMENIVGAAALLLESKKMSPVVFARAVSKFRGIKRRIELKNPKGQIPVYDGFGSSYEKTRAIFEALRVHYPARRIIAVFEPHAFSWRNKKFLHWYKNIFKGVGVVIMLPATSHGKPDPMEVSTREIWQEAKKHFPIFTAKGEKEALKILKKTVKKSDVVALISSGPMFGLTESVPKMFKTLV